MRDKRTPKDVCGEATDYLDRGLAKFARARREPQAAQALACVAWRFCRSGRRSGEAATAPISSRFVCPRPPLLLSAPNQNRHATQATQAQYESTTWKLGIKEVA